MPTVLVGPTIAAGESLSDGIDCSGTSPSDLVRIVMPAEWTDAPLTFQLSNDGISWNDAFTMDGYEVQAVAVANSVVIVPLTVGRSVGWIKIRSGSRADPIAQEAERVFTMVLDK